MAEVTNNTNGIITRVIVEKGEQGERGTDGVSVESIEQTTTSSESEGTNIITATLSDGTTSTFNIKNGKQGKKGDTGNPGASPLVASSTAGMTDTSRIYVNTTDGKWYYYNGSEWTIGGIYQSTGIADGSISQKKLKNNINGSIIKCNFTQAYPSLFIRFDNQTSLTKFKIKGKIKNEFAEKFTSLLRFQLLSGLDIINNTVTSQSNLTLKKSDNTNISTIYELYANDYIEFELHNDELSLSNINGFMFGLNIGVAYKWDYYLKDIEIYANDVLVNYYLENGTSKNPTTNVNFIYDDIDFLQTHSQNDDLLENAIKLYNGGFKSNPRVIACWGDSLTEGTMPSGTPYPTKLQTLINNENINVVNLGVNGNSSGTIGVRQGAIKLQVASSFIIPADTTPVSCDINILNSNGNTFRNVTNIPVIISDIKGTLVVSSVTDSTLSCTFTRETAGTQTSVAQNTNIYSQQDKYRSDTTIIWAGRNDDVNYGIYLINNINAMVNYLDTQYPSYLVISVTLAKTESSATSGTGAFITRHNEILKRNFKNNYVDLNSYLVDQCIYDLGLTPTQADLTRMNAGAIPEPLFADNVHFTDACRQKIAEYLYNELLQRHYIY